MSSLICPICEQSVASFHPNSHIVPEWMYRRLYDQRNSALLIQFKNVTIQKIKKGLRRSIICNDCEVLFSADDRYASIALGKSSLRSPEFTDISRRPLDIKVKEFTEVEGLEFRKLQKFVFGVILRASLAPDLTSDKSLIVKKHFKAIKDLYFKNDSRDDLAYPIMVNENYEEDPHRKIIILPFHRRIDRQHAVQFSGAGFTFNIIISGHEISKNLSLLRLKNTGSIIMTHGKFTETGTFKSFISPLRKIFAKYGHIESGKKIKPKSVFKKL